LKVLWAPWRLSYVGESVPPSGCIFCDKPCLQTADDRRRDLVLRTTETTAVIMNLYPYANGHLLVAPRVHTCDFPGLDAKIGNDLQREIALCVDVLTRAYAPAGFNIGMNLGRAGGAGIADHLHWHVVPRWEGDTNFMPMLADTRVIPQHIEDAYDRLLPLFEDAR
jgi:ATP adenylyltransferase